jgi:hypothetical protein
MPPFPIMFLCSLQPQIFGVLDNPALEKTRYDEMKLL